MLSCSVGPARQSTLGTDATLCFWGDWGIIFLFWGLFLVKSTLGFSSEAWWQFPNKDKHD